MRRPGFLCERDLRRDAELARSLVSACRRGGGVPSSAFHRRVLVTTGSPAQRRTADEAAAAIDALAGHDVLVAAHPVNGRIGLVMRERGRVTAVVVFARRGARVSQLWIVTDPGRLTSWNRPGPVTDAADPRS